MAKMIWSGSIGVEGGVEKFLKGAGINGSITRKVPLIWPFKDGRI
jgi:hypothetical protein